MKHTFSSGGITACYPALAVLLIFSAIPTKAQSDGKKWSQKAFDQKAFIENRGQFSSSPGKDIAYAADWGDAKVLFTKSGLIYQFTTFEVRKEGSIELPPGKTREVLMEWKGAEPAVELLVEEKAPGSFLHPKADGRSSGYKKLIYRNLYRNIDAEYVFHPEGGLKYSFLLHPGANVSDIQMLYTGAERIFTDISGNLHVKNPVNETTEQAPLSFYPDKSTVPSFYSLDGNIVRIEVPGYDPSRGLVIDPWVNNPMFATDNRAFEAEADQHGNVYIYGSDKNFKLQKYNSLGVLQWTYDSEFINNLWFGDLAVDSTGNSFISTGDGRLKKVTPAGTTAFSIIAVLPVGFGLEELFLLCFSKTLPNLTLMAGHGPGEATVYLKEVVEGREVAVGLIKNPRNDELRAVCSSKNGSYYTISETANFNGSPSASKLIRFDNLLQPIFEIPSGYSGQSFGYFGTRYKPKSNSGGAPNGSQNALSASECFVFSYDGSLLIKRDAATGSMISTLRVPNGVDGENSGIYTDECNQVYVGTKTGVKVYDSFLNLIDSAATPGAVYDVKYNYAANQIIACGDGFVASFDIALPCAPVSCANTVPVSLLEFKASIAGNTVSLSWSTATEKDCGYFEIEKSSDGQNFEPFERVSCSGNSTVLQSYQAKDNSPYQGTSYYKLKEIGYNGITTLERLAVVKNPNEVTFSIAPNPVKEGTTFKVLSSRTLPEALDVTIYNLLGETVYMQRRTAGESAGFNVAGLPPGRYILKLSSGSLTERKKLVIE